MQPGDMGPFKVTSIVHLAAHADIAGNWTSDADRERIFRSNIEGTFRLLEAAPPDLKRFVFVSSACVSDPAESPYKTSKLAGESMVKAWAAHYRWRFTILRPASMVGPGYHHGHIVDFVRQAKETGKVHAKDDGRHAKPFVHVDRVARRIVEAATDPHGPSETLDVVDARWSWRDTARLMKVAFTCEDRIVGWDGDPTFEFFFYGRNKNADDVARGVSQVLEEQGWNVP